DAVVAYRGYCAPDALGDVKGKVVVCHGTHRAGLPNDAQRRAAARTAGAAAYVAVADPGFTVEPPRWPFAYARTVWRADAAPDSGDRPGSSRRDDRSVGASRRLWSGRAGRRRRTV